MQPKENDTISNIGPNPTPTPVAGNADTKTQQDTYIEQRTIQPLSSEFDIRGAVISSVDTTPTTTLGSAPAINDLATQNNAGDNTINPQVSSIPAQSITDTASFRADLPPISDNHSTHKKKWRKPVVIVLLVTLLAIGGFFAYGYIFPNSHILPSNTADTSKSGAKVGIPKDTAFVIPNVNYANYDKGQLNKCLNNMTTTDYEVECGLVNFEHFDKVQVSMTFKSGKLTDQHTPYLVKDFQCDITGLAQVNKSIAGNTPLDQPLPKVCNRLLTPEGHTVYLSTLNNTTTTTIAAQDYYFIKDNNLITMQVFLGVPATESNKTISTDTLSTTKQNILAFVDSMI